MDEKLRKTYLYDFYGELLNAHQRQVYEGYLFEDLSLAELADDTGTSRQAVHDLIKRCSKSLEGYEAKLHLLERFLHIKEDVAQIHELTQQPDATASTMSQIASISNAILEEL